MYVESVAALPGVTLVPLEGALAHEAAEIAADLALRGMDAIYVAVARFPLSHHIARSPSARHRHV